MIASLGKDKESAATIIKCHLLIDFIIKDSIQIIVYGWIEYGKCLCLRSNALFDMFESTQFVIYK